jgi:hypothetical protein
MSAMTINVPESLFGKLIEVTEKNQGTPEQFALLALAEKLSGLITVDYLEERKLFFLEIQVFVLGGEVLAENAEALAESAEKNSAFSARTSLIHRKHSLAR